MPEVRISEGESVQWAIKTFRRKVQRAGILKDVRSKRFYIKPSLARRKKAAAARRRQRSKQGRR